MSSARRQSTTIAVSHTGIGTDVVRRAADALRAGQIVAIPTDTVYGLAAAIDRPDAIATLYAIKGRPAEKAIPVLIAGTTHIRRLTPCLTATAAQLARTYWPGALTLVLPAMPGLPPAVTAATDDGTQTVAVRVPDSALARDIIEAAGGALAVTSANRSGATPAVEAKDVQGLHLTQPLLIVDGGPAPGGVPSTIVRVVNDSPEILREGAIPAAAIAAAVADVAPPTGVRSVARYHLPQMRQECGGSPKEHP